MKTWPELEALAKADLLRLHRSHGGVTVYTTDVLEAPMLSITPHGTMEEDDEDMVVRTALEAGLKALKVLAR